MRDVALITGASGGIGLELAKIHAASGGDLVLVARNTAKLEAIRKVLTHEHSVNVVVMPMDLSRQESAELLFGQVRSEGINVDILVNNAGFGGHGLFFERDWQRDKEMITLNITTLTGLTRLFVPEMMGRKTGRILNVASMAGFLPGPLQAVYYATKAYVLSYSEAIGNELDGTGITVTALCPGATATGFLDAADLGGVDAFKMAASADDVAAYGYQAMLDGKAVAVPGFANKTLAHGLLRMLPRKLVTKISRRSMEKSV